jgi:hypothetical protein
MERQHMEEQHAEGHSPFVVQDEGSVASDLTIEDQSYAQCPIDGCEEILPAAELDEHLDLHVAEQDQHDASDSSDLTSAPAKAYHPPAKTYRSPYDSVSDSGYSSSNSPRQENVGPRASSRHPDSKNRNSGSIQRWKQIFGVPSGGKRSTATPKQVGEHPRKRLGVRGPFSHGSFRRQRQGALADPLSRNRSWANTRMRMRCLTGLYDCFLSRARLPKEVSLDCSMIGPA